MIIVLFSPIVFSKWTDNLPDPPSRYDPRIKPSLSGGDDQGSESLPLGLRILCDAHYSYGTAVSPDGDIYFTQFNKMRVSKYDPLTGQTEVVISNRGGLYGIAFDVSGNMFLGIDGGFKGGKVVKRNPDGSEEEIMTGLTRPRQVICDKAGNVYVAVEGDEEILKWNKTTKEILTVIKDIPTVQGVAIGPKGQIYFSQYGIMKGRGVALKPGYIGVVNPDGTYRVIADGFWRARGISVDFHGNIYLVTEANAWDQGNSGLIVRVKKGGEQEVLLSGIDYPEFPTIGKDGQLYVTLGRDNKLVSFNPQHRFNYQTTNSPDFKMAVENAEWQITSGEAGIKIAIKADNLPISGFLDVESSTDEAAIWIDIPANRLNLSLEELPYHTPERPTPGIFELPKTEVRSQSGRCSAFVIPRRNHTRCRCPIKLPFWQIFVLK